jgi:hypothetical protein
MRQLPRSDRGGATQNRRVEPIAVTEADQREHARRDLPRDRKRRDVAELSLESEVASVLEQLLAESVRDFVRSGERRLSIVREGPDDEHVASDRGRALFGWRDLRWNLLGKLSPLYTPGL